MTPSYLVPPITQHYYPAHQGLILLYLKVLSQQRRQSNFNHASGPAQVQRLYCSLQRLEACCYIYSPVDISIIYCGLVLWYQNRLCPCPWLLSKPQASSYNVRINKYWQISGLTKTLVQEMYCLLCSMCLLHLYDVESIDIWIRSGTYVSCIPKWYQSRPTTFGDLIPDKAISNGRMNWKSA